MANTAAEWSDSFAVPDRRAVGTLSVEQKRKYARDGWVVISGVLSGVECDELIAHMAEVHAPDGQWPEETPGLGQPHLKDDTVKRFMLHPQLRQPLSDILGGDEPEGIKSYYWWRGSDWSQSWHCDGTALPGCVGAWLPLVDVDAVGP